MSNKLIPMLDTVLRTRNRKVQCIDIIDTWPKMRYNTKNPHERIYRDLLIWIDKNTTGRFYLDSTVVAFQDEQDLIMFKLGYKEPE